MVAGKVQKETVILSLLGDDGGRTDFEYDRQGNLFFERSGSGTTSYAYDAFNRTAKAEKRDGSYVLHEYDPEGLRSGICENGVTSRFVFDGWNMVNELDEEWNAKASYVRAMNCWRKWTALETPTTT